MPEVADPDTLLSRAEAAVVRALALGAASAEAYVASGSSVGVDIESDQVTYTTAETESGLGLRVLLDGRLGFAYASNPSKLDDAVHRALSLSRLSTDRDYSFPSGVDRYPDVTRLYDQGVAGMEPPEAVAMAGELVDAARGAHAGITVAGGGVGVGVGAAAVANSEGVAVASSMTIISTSAYVVLRDTTVSTGHESLVSHMRDLDPQEVGLAAARIAMDAQGAEPLGVGGEMTVVFRPTALAELIEFTVVPSVIGDAAQRGESAYTGREGEAVASVDITLLDDPLLAGGVNSGPFDGDGVPSRRNTVIEGGVLQGFLYDTLTANEYDVETTASAVRGATGGDGWKSPPEPYASNVVLEVPTRGELEDLVADVDRGLLVHDVLGAHTANRSSLDFSVNSTMPFEIRRGELLGVRHPVMLGGNMGDLLGRVVGGGGKVRQCPGGLSAANIVLPWVAADGITVTP